MDYLLNLEFSCWLYDLPKKRVDEVLELVRLRERAKDPVRTFSNGMRQRLMIARALLHRPPMLFLDEPGRGLDPIAAHEIRQTIRQLNQEGMTILLTTHIMEEAEQLCQQIAFVVNGRIVANDTPRNLKLAYGKPAITIMLNNNNPDKYAQSEEITLLLDNPVDQEQLCQLMAEGKVRAIHSHEASLEEVFIAVAGTPLV